MVDLGIKIFRSFSARMPVGTDKITQTGLLLRYAERHRGSMKTIRTLFPQPTVKLGLILLWAVFLAGPSLSGEPARKVLTFRGEISDKLCGFSHPELIGDARKCTLDCVRAGSRFVLADREKGLVLDLLGKTIPEELAGKQVQVIGIWFKKRGAVRIYTITPVE